MPERAALTPPPRGAMNPRIPIAALLLLACDEPIPPAPAVAAQQAPDDPPEVIAARTTRMAALLDESRCLKHPEAERWSGEVATMRAAYIDGRFAESIMSAQRAFDRCDDMDLVRHMAHCYETLGMSKKADEIKRRYKRQFHQRRRIRVGDTPTRSDDASIQLHDVEATGPKEP
jgi:hypothetical protein